MICIIALAVLMCIGDALCDAGAKVAAALREARRRRTCWRWTARHY